jgi:hypothetical protein
MDSSHPSVLLNINSTPNGKVPETNCALSHPFSNLPTLADSKAFPGQI